MDKSAIKNELQKLGISPALLGYHYLVDSICRVMECLNNGKIKIKITDIYEQTAKELGSKAVRVERAIRHSIERAFEIGPYELVERFGSLISANSGKLTNTCFILTLAEQLRKEHNSEI